MATRAAWWAALCLSVTQTQANELFDRLDATGSLRADYFSRARAFQDKRDWFSASAWLKIRAPLSQSTSLSLSAISWDAQSDRVAQEAGVMQEAFLRYRSSTVDLRVGKQVLAWGRADFINPTDNLSPRNMQRFVIDPADNRVGSWAASATYIWRASGLSVSGVWIPDPSPHVIPWKAPMGMVIDRAGSLGPSWAVKLDRSGGDVDWSISYYKGPDLLQSLGVRVDPLSQSMRPVMDHAQVHVLGADFATSWGDVGVRGEWACAYRSMGPDRITQINKRSSCTFVIGADRALGAQADLNVQYAYARVLGFRDPLPTLPTQLQYAYLASAGANDQLRRDNHLLSIKLGWRLMHDDLKLEWTSLHSMNSAERVLMPKISYQVGSHWTWSIGAQHFRGQEFGVFGRLKDTSGVFLESRFSF
jgi:hypothetical protein